MKTGTAGGNRSGEKPSRAWNVSFTYAPSCTGAVQAHHAEPDSGSFLTAIPMWNELTCTLHVNNSPCIKWAGVEWACGRWSLLHCMGAACRDG